MLYLLKIVSQLAFCVNKMFFFNITRKISVERFSNTPVNYGN